jgi:colicin import membrane protein
MELTKQAAAGVPDQTVKADAVVAATAAFNGTKVGRDKIAGEKAVADDTAAKVAARLQAATAAKAAADKAVADTAVTPELQKQLADAESAAKSGTELTAALKGALERLNSAKGRGVQTLEASTK